MRAVMARWSKARYDQVVSGTLGGIAERFGWNPTWVRVIYVVFTILTGIVPGVLLYLLLALLMK